jgi:uncharacterized Zn finger protein
MKMPAEIDCPRCPASANVESQHEELPGMTEVVIQCPNCGKLRLTYDCR